MIFNQGERQQEIKRWENRLVKTCTICNGTGSIEKEVGQPGKMCNCMHTALLNAHLVGCGVPRKFLNSSWDWEGFKNASESMKKVKAYADNFKEHYFNGRGLYLYGQQGRGKSMLEALAAKDIAHQINPDNDKHFKVAFIIFEELIQMSHEARVNYETKVKMNRIIAQPELLIIDNLGSETGQKSESGHVPRFLEFILRKRNNDCLPTIISSNYTPEQLKVEYTDTIHQFIEENFELVSVIGDNWRQIRGGQQLDDDFLLDGIEDDLLGGSIDE